MMRAAQLGHASTKYFAFETGRIVDLNQAAAVRETLLFLSSRLRSATRDRVGHAIQSVAQGFRICRPVFPPIGNPDFDLHQTRTGAAVYIHPITIRRLRQRTPDKP
jgi:hypothetical protein